MEAVGKLHWADFVVIGVYFLALILVGVWSICRPGVKGGKGSTKSFFLAGRNMTWWPIGMSLFASNIGANNFVGTAGSGANSGLAVIMFEWSAVPLLMLLGWVFLPVYISSGIYTIPEYLEQRFGGRRLRVYLSIIALFTYLFVTISADLYTGGIFLQQTVGLNLYIGVVAMLVVSVIYTTLGGLVTVLFTDALAVIIMMVGGMTLFVIGLVRVGGYEALQYRYMRGAPNTTFLNQSSTCGRPREDALHIFRSLGADYPWLGTLLRSTFGALWYWCANQVLVQRTLAAKTMTHARAACIFASYLKLMPMAIIVFPGLVSRALFPDEVGCADPAICERVCSNPAGCSNIAYPKLVVELLPLGLRGLMIAAMLAAVISSLTSVFNSSATLFAMDLWPRVRPSAGERETLLVSKAFMLVLAALSVLWIPVMQASQGGEIYKYTSKVSGYMGAPTCAMFVLAIFWSRTTEPGAFWGVVLAQLFGVVRFVLEVIYPAPLCGHPDNRIGFIKNLNGYDYTAIQVSLCFVAIILISLFTEPIARDKYKGLTFWTRFEKPLKDEIIESQLKEIKNAEKTGGATTDVAVLPGEAPDAHSAPSTDDNVQYETHEARLEHLKQTPALALFTNINAVIIVGITVGLYGLFS